ncbi:glycosyltransferase [Streptomyces xiamenensis]|uniref:glycosyltransferase family 2 protein n=1 Tax=Streptomyces xiamenensis TaxID=408015 RepID=UPI003D72E0BD
MSVHSQQPAHPSATTAAAATPAFPQHVVTAVLVSHDGERWLPEVLTGLLGQDRPVQDVIAADTGSADSSATLVTEAFGADRVLHLARRTGFGTAVAEAARSAPVLTPDDLPYLKRPEAWDPTTRTWNNDVYDLPEFPHGEPVHWLWLLHDDSAPEPDALVELLRQADASPSAAVIGAKLRGWYDRRQLLEAGVTIANSGRRWTGLDRREQDQGQHDQVRPVLSVSTAGMLIRRDVYEELGGFDRRLPLMRDDVDLCWRAHSAGHNVLIAPGAVLRHAEAAARERRTIDCSGRTAVNPHRVDKAAAAYTLLTGVRTRALPWVLFRLVLGTMLRVLGYLVGKLPGRALDEATGLLATLLRPGRVLAARKRRPKAAEPGELRTLFPPAGATLRATVEQIVGAVSARSEAAAATSGGGRHGGPVESGPGDDDTESLQVEQFARLKRLARKPGLVLFVGLFAVAAVAARDLIGGGALAGGALLPAPADISTWWDRVWQTWQPVGTGGAESAPPYLGALALVAGALLGNPGVAMTALLVCSVPLAGVSAYLTSKPLVTSRLLRAWAAIAYAFLPAVTGALATGRVGTAVLAVLLPPLVRCAVAAAGHTRDSGKGSWRAAWAAALLLTVATAFTPVMWPLAVLLAVVSLALPLRLEGALRVAKAVRFAAILLTPLLLLAPWSFSVLLSPDEFRHEAGLRFDTGAATATQLLNANPGGPGTPGSWLLIGLLFAALGALLRTDRRLAIGTAWSGALLALLFGVWVNDSAWAGPATLLYGIALLSAAVLGADGARGRVAAQSFGWRQPVAVAVATAAAAGPLLVAAGWMISGADGPLQRRDPVQVPAFVAEESSTRDQARTLVLAGESDSADGLTERVTYTLVRGSGARLGDADVARLLGEDTALTRAVGDLVAGSGADQTEALAAYAVRYVLVQDGSPAELRRVLDTTPGLKRLSQEDGGALWRVESPVGRVMVLPAEGSAEAPVALPAGPVEAHTDLPEGEAGRVLRLADTADEAWTATLDGTPLKPVTVGGWAQGFELPEGGGKLALTYDTPGTHTLWVWTQGFLLLVVAVLALPGRRKELDDDLPDPEEAAAAAVPTQGRGARRRAAAEAAEAARTGETADAGDTADAPDHASPPPGPDPEPQPEPAPEPGYVPQQQGYYQDQQPQQQQDWAGYYDQQQQQQQQQYGGWDGQYPQQQQQQQQNYQAPYDYPADYGDGSSQR